MSDLTVIDKIIRAARHARDSATRRREQSAGPAYAAADLDRLAFDDFIAALEQIRQNPRG